MVHLNQWMLLCEQDSWLNMSWLEEAWIISKSGWKIFWIKCEPLNGIQWEKHTDNATLNHYFTVSLQTVFRFSYYFL